MTAAPALPTPSDDAGPSTPEALRRLMDGPSAGVGAHAVTRQQRSREKMDCVLRVTQELLQEGGPSKVTTTLVAARAGISVGWLYNYFRDREALIEEVLVHGLRDLDARLAEVPFDLAGPGWRRKAEAGVDAHIAFFGALPAFRRLRFSSELSGRVIRAHRLHDDELAAFLASTITEVREDAPTASRPVVTRVFVGMLDTGIDLAYRADPLRGDDALLQEMRRSSVDYLATYLP